MKLLDYLVIGAYALGMLAIGRYFKERTYTADDYHLGGRKMSPLMIGISLFATLTSTLSYLAYPGEMVKHGPMMFASLTAYPLVFVFVGWVLIPWIMRQPVTSGYELLTERLGTTGRLLGSGMFICLRTFWMASILYATAVAVLVPLFGLDMKWFPLIAAAMGIITMIYTAEGGIRAVVMTDALQSLVMFVGAIAILGVVSMRLGGVSAWWPKAWPDHWQEPVFWFRADVRVTFAGAFLNMLIWMICTAGADQMAIQRYLSTRDVGTARRSFGIHLVTETILSVLLGLVGLAVLAYFVAFPSELASGSSLSDQADQLLPRFIVIGLPAGFTGLVIAALLSAAMSSLSSGMSSSSAVIVADFIARWYRDELTQHDQIQLARRVSWIVGVVAITLSTVVGSLARNLLELCIKVVNLLTAPLFVLFFMALFIRWSTPLGAVAATVASVTVAIGIAFFQWGNLEFLWVTPCSLLAGVVVGAIVSPLGKPARSIPG